MALSKFNLRDLFWLVLVVALSVGWWAQAWYVRATEKADEQEAMTLELQRAQEVAACADRIEILMVDISQDSFRRFGPFVAREDAALLKEIQRCLRQPDSLERNPYGHSRPLSGHYLEITLVCTQAPMREYRLWLIESQSIALGDGATYRAVRLDSKIWEEAGHLTTPGKSIRWNNESL